MPSDTYAAASNAEKYAAAALMGLALAIEHHDTGVVAGKPSQASIDRAQQVVKVILEGGDDYAQ